MARDYKHSKRSSAGSGLSGLSGFVAGLALGLMVAFGVYLYDRRPEARLAASATRSAGQGAPMTREDAEAPMTREEDRESPAPASQDTETRFDFYEMLPKFEVVVPEQDGRVPPGAAAGGAVQKAGAYVLQAGSFRNHADADRVRALLAMQGVESRIQKVTIDKDTWHRVRVGPITDLRKLEQTRSKLRQARIEALVIRVGE